MTLSLSLAAISYRPIAPFDLGLFTLSLHGIFAAVGFLAGAWYTTRLFGKRGFDMLKLQSVLTWALLGALLGARWLTIPAYWVDNGFDLGELVNIGGNYSILGGFAGGIGIGVWRARMLGLRIWPTLDLAAFGLALGTVVGRIGDLAIVEHLGGPTSFFLGYGIRPGYDVAPQHNALQCTPKEVIGEFCGVYHHAALYDMLGAAVLLGVLIWIYRSAGTRLRYGQLFAVWAAWYGLQRFLIDFTRLALEQGGDRVLGPLTWSQWSALATGVGGLALLAWLGKRNLPATPENDRAMGMTPALPEDVVVEPDLDDPTSTERPALPADEDIDEAIILDDPNYAEDPALPASGEAEGEQTRPPD